MPQKKLSPAEKSKIALSAIVGEVLGKSTTEVGAQFGVSAKAVTAIKKQALDAIQQSFYGVQAQTSSPTGLSDKEVSARLDKLLGNIEASSPLSSRAAATDPPTLPSPSAVDDRRDEEELIPIDEIVAAIQQYNNATESGRKIYISRAIVAEISPHPTKEIEDFFTKHKAQIDAHNEKHELKRSTNRGLKGQDWISWLNLYEEES
jgi:hypothetical protein